MRITVTAEHIKRGRRQSARACPVALAIRTATGWQAEVGLFAIDLADRRDRFRMYVRTPPSAAEFIRRFDGCLNVAPFAFDLDVKRAAS